MKRATHQPPALLWFRDDLRLADHAALRAAIASGRAVLPVFVLDLATPGRWAPGGAARWWLHHSLAALAADLAARGAPLVLRRGPASREIPRLVRATGAAEVFAGAANEPWARREEAAVAAALGQAGIGFRRFRTATLFEPTALRTRSGSPFSVFTPFARAAHATGPQPPAPVPERILAADPPASDDLASWRLLPRDREQAAALSAAWTPGEAAAQARLAQFLATGLDGYADRRDFPAVAGTSMLSPHLHFGEISAAQAWHAASLAGDTGGARKFLDELLWRDFAKHLLWHHPAMAEEPLRPGFARMPWREDAAALRAWQGGRTGVPIVDAGMRELRQIGWMHNRVRMIVASFLVKHLLIPWQDGAAWFWDRLVDADLANNSAGWQWVAGSGADAAPYFRVFNPVLQGRKFDPDGAYVGRWVPELAQLEAGFRHAPWEAPEAALRRAGIVLGRDYPRPMIDLAAGRDRALAAFAAIRKKAA